MKNAARELAIAGVLATVICFALGPGYLEHWDEIQLRFGMERFDLAWHQPHPPGYVLFVLFGKLFSFADNPGRILSWLATLGFLALTIPRVSDRRMRFGVAVLLPLVIVLSPTLLTHVTTGRTYVVESTLWVAALLLFASRLSPLTYGGLIGVAGGFRPTLLLWGLVLVLLRPGRARAVLGMIGAASIWFAILLALTGGRYFALAAPLLRDNIGGKSMFARGARVVLAERLPVMIDTLWSALGPLLLVTGALSVMRVTRRELKPLDPLLFGALLSFVFYLVMIFDSDGYALSYALPLLAWTALAGATLIPARVAAPVVVALAMASAFIPGGLATDTSVPAARRRIGDRCATRMAAIESLPDVLAVTGTENLAGWSFRMIMARAPAVPVLQLAHDPYFYYVSAARPYLLGRNRRLSAVPEDLDVSTLGARYVVLAAPREAAARLHPSCFQHMTSLTTARGESMPLFDLQRTRVRARAERLYCE